MEFIETPLFTRQIVSLLSDDDYADLQRILAINPQQGDLIPAGGGYPENTPCQARQRKKRWHSCDLLLDYG